MNAWVRLSVGMAMMVSAYGGVRAVFADSGSSGCQGYVHSNGAVSCTPNSGCDDGCVIKVIPGSQLQPPDPNRNYHMCDCTDWWFGEEDVCSAAAGWDQTTTPPSFASITCLDDPDAACPPETTCQMEEPLIWPIECNCK